MYILGINAYHADSSAAIFKDGMMVAATEEERFTRVKHWAGFPALAIQFCLGEAGIGLGEVDYITIGRDPKAKFLNKLNLSDEQRKQIEANKMQHRQKMQATHQALKASHDAMKEELMKPQLDMARINQIHQQIKDMQNQMEDEKLSSILEVRSILTAEQFEIFLNLMHQHKPEHEWKN